MSVFNVFVMLIYLLAQLGFANSVYKQLQSPVYENNESENQNANLNMFPSDLLKVIHDFLPKKDQKNCVLVAQKIADAVCRLSGCISIRMNSLQEGREKQSLIRLQYPRIQVQIEHPGVADEQIQLLSQLSNLTALYVKDVTVSKETLDLSLPSWPKLSVLSLAQAWLYGDNKLQNLSILEHLSELDLSKCRGLTSNECKFLSFLTNLGVLNLSYCSYLDPNDMSSLSSLSRLHTLNTSFSQTSSLQYLSHIGNLKNLNMCCVKKTFFHDLDVDELRYLSCIRKLETLNMSGCSQFGDNCLQYISSLTDLVCLHIESCNITVERLKCLSQLVALNELDISSCKQHGNDALQYLSDLTSLKMLKMFFCRPQLPSGVLYLSKLTNLTHLDISYNKMEHWKDLQHLSVFKMLKHLDVSHCSGITPEKLKHILSLTSLKELKHRDSLSDKL